MSQRAEKTTSDGRRLDTVIHNAMITAVEKASFQWFFVSNGWMVRYEDDEGNDDDAANNKDDEGCDDAAVCCCFFLNILLLLLIMIFV